MIILYHIIDYISKTADVTNYSWYNLRSLLNKAIQTIILNYNYPTEEHILIDGESFNIRLNRIYDTFLNFDSPPFTIQRMCELIIEPTRYYKN